MALTGPQQAQFGFGQESTWGTAVAPDKFLPLLSESLDKSFDVLTDEAVRVGRRLPIAEQHILGNQQIGGSITTHIYGVGMRQLLQALFGTETDPGAGSPTRAFTYTPGDLSDDMLTLETRAPASSASQNDVKTVEGASMTGATFEYTAGQLATVTWDFVGQALTRGASATSASFPVAIAHRAIGMAFTLTGLSSATNLKQARVRVENALAADRFRVDSDLRKQPIEAGLRMVEADLTLEYGDDFAETAHEAHTEVDLALSSTDGTNSLGWAIHGYIGPGAGPKLNTRTGLLEHQVNIKAHADAGGSATDADAVTVTYTTSEDVV